MISKSDLRAVVMQQWGELTNYKITSRTVAKRIKRQTEFIAIITGVRRSGKSTLLKQLISQYKRCRYLNFEDFRLTGFEYSDFANLEAVFGEQQPDCDVYFFDEIQNVPGWENYLRTLNDAKKNVIVTGSNASLLSKELGTKLTGRHVDYELFPMDFFEYCEMKSLQANQRAIGMYLAEGGFPQYLKTGSLEYLQQILNDILYRDIVKRHNIRSISVLEEVARFLITNITNEYSLRNISRMLQKFSIHTLSEFVGYLEDAYLLFSVPVFAYSRKQQSVNPKKIYAIDNGLAGANSLGFTEDRGKLLENAVFLHLRRQFSDVFYFKGKSECDFVVKSRNRILGVVQVCYEINAGNLAREIRGLEEAMVATKCKNGVIVTFDESGEYKTKTAAIRAVPILEWFKESR